MGRDVVSGVAGGVECARSTMSSILCGAMANSSSVDAIFRDVSVSSF